MMKTTGLTSLNNCSDAKNLLQQAGRIAKAENFAITLLGILQTLCTISFAALIAVMINDAVYLQHNTWPQPLWWLGLIVVLCLKACLPLLQSRFADKASIKIRNALRHTLLQHCQQLNIQLFPNFTTAELSNLISTEIDSMREFFAEFLPQKRLAMLTPILIIIASSSINWLVPLILALTAPMVPLFMIIVGHKAAAASQQNLVQLNRLGSLLSDRIKGLSALQLAGTTQTEQQALLAQSENYRLSTMRVLRLAFLSGTILEFFSAISVALVAVYLGLFFLDKYQIGSWSDSITLGHGVFLLMLAPEFYLPLRRLGTLYHARADAMSVAEHLIKLLQLTPHQDFAPTKKPTATFSPPINTISLVKLSTGHLATPPSKPINLTITSGESVLLLGASGAGKSTLLETLAGFLTPLSGEILLDGQPAVLQNNPHWLGQIGYMTQKPELLFESIRNNLCLGRDFSDQQLFAALALAQVDDVVRALPATLDYQISENGGYLSGGQAQRIALARVFLHQPRLLLLDEPTANLDDQTAELFLQSLENFTSQGGMLILASHRVVEDSRFQKTVTITPHDGVAAHA